MLSRMAGRSLPHLALPAHGVTRKCRGSPPPPDVRFPIVRTPTALLKKKRLKHADLCEKTLTNRVLCNAAKLHAICVVQSKRVPFVHARTGTRRAHLRREKGSGQGAFFLYASPFQLSRTCTNDGAEAHASALPAQLFKHNQAVRTFLRPRHRRRLRHRRRSLRQSRHQNSRSRQRWSRSRHRSPR